MASDIAKPNMDSLNRAGEQGDLAAAGGKQANLKLAQQFMALAQSDNAPAETQVTGQGQITIDRPQNEPAHIGEGRIDWGFPEFGPGPISPHPPIFGPGRPPFLPPNIIPGRPITLPPDFTLGQSISMPTGTFERVDGEWIYTPREPDVTIGPDHGGSVQICPDEEWYFSPREPSVTIGPDQPGVTIVTDDGGTLEFFPIDVPTRITDLGTVEIIDGEWHFSPKEPDVTIGPIDGPRLPHDHGTVEIIDGEWHFSPREPDVTIGPIDGPRLPHDHGTVEINDGEWYFSPKETAGDWTFDGSGQSAEES